MNTDHLVNLLFIISLAGGSLAGLLALACLPLGLIRAKHHDKSLLGLAKACFGIMILLVSVCLVLYFVTINDNKI